MITTIPQVIDVLEEICDEYTDIDERRPIIRIIQFCQKKPRMNRRWLRKHVLIP